MLAVLGASCLPRADVRSTSDLPCYHLSTGLSLPTGLRSTAGNAAIPAESGNDPELCRSTNECLSRKIEQHQ